MKGLISLIVLLLFPVITRSETQNWQLGFPPPASPVMERVTLLHTSILYLIAIIVLLVGALLFFILIRYRKQKGRTPQTFSHNPLLEIIWTAIPAIILLILAVPSIKLLYYQDRAVTHDMTLKVTGSQWYWSYEYPSHDIVFDAHLLKDEEQKEGYQRLLSTDYPIVVPVDTVIQVLVTSVDVLHAWAVPAFGVKIDAVPGRLNETWFHAKKQGTYYGQCSELCGHGHGFMPIEVKVVSKEKFSRWITAQKQETK